MTLSSLSVIVTVYALPSFLPHYLKPYTFSCTRTPHVICHSWVLNLHFRQRHTQPVPRCLRCLLPQRFRERGYVPLESLSVLPAADAPQLLARVEQLYRGAEPPISNGGVALPTAAEPPASLKQVARRIELQQVIAELLPRVACNGPQWNGVANGYRPGTIRGLVMANGDISGGQWDAWHSEPVLQRTNSTAAAAGEEPWVLARRRARARHGGSGSEAVSSVSASSSSQHVQSPDTPVSPLAPTPTPPPVRGRAHERRAAGGTEEQHVLQSLRAILARYASEERADWNVAEWQFLARFVDRVLFWLYLTFTAASTLLILLLAPLLQLRS